MTLNRSRKKASGFTIVELLIVIVIIAILSTLVVMAYNGITEKANQSRRISDISSVRKALELYRQEVGYYPANGADNWGGALNSAAMTTALAPYMNQIPTEPTGDASKAYQYVRGVQDNYGIRIFWSETPLTGCHWTQTSNCRFCKIGKDLDYGTTPTVSASWYGTVGCPGFKSGFGY